PDIDRRLGSMEIKIPSEMFPGMTNARSHAVEAQHVFVMRCHIVGEFSTRFRRVCRKTGCRPGDRPCQPGGTIMSAADHHCVSARLFQARRRVMGIKDVTIRHYWYGDSLLDLRNCSPVGFALIELTARAAMNRHHAHARILSLLRNQRRIEHG